ncbi:hypothetical protein C9397_12780 [Xanthomonas vasicola pv. vasculorum]|nr:hypothetical protein KW5_0117990 [Xanthomonas vasicola pv. vasculorum NCPPB 1326]OWF62386.1 hypothetical protein B1H32_06185 [Xanthomonas vasicola pv. vasculorum]PUE74280.1 hypothetical protein C7Y61_08450 [Xanthomonas vasicola pv. vasculorum]RNK42734.1 hypothetical protein C9396_15825 [Xanthomonas vasicola pv. vasculorum]RNK46208.1 hypothetical protein C9401_08450 [Xanthomonas vasicola pv. vasculorum]
MLREATDKFPRAAVERVLMVHRRRSALAVDDDSESMCRTDVPDERAPGFSGALMRFTQHNQQRFRTQIAGAPALTSDLLQRTSSVFAAAIAVTGSAVVLQRHAVIPHIP